MNYMFAKLVLSAKFVKISSLKNSHLHGIYSQELFGIVTYLVVCSSFENFFPPAKDRQLLKDSLQFLTPDLVYSHCKSSLIHAFFFNSRTMGQP